MKISFLTELSQGIQCGFIMLNLKIKAQSKQRNRPPTKFKLCPTAGDSRGPLIILSYTLRKHAYINILNILPPKNENFQIKNSDIFHISAQNIDCGYSLEPPRRGGSNEYPQSMILAEIRKNNIYPYKPQFYYIKVGFKGVRII